jgi:hypothetical protein
LFELVLFPVSAYYGAWSFLKLAKHLNTRLDLVLSLVFLRAYETHANATNENMHTKACRRSLSLCGGRSIRGGVIGALSALSALCPLFSLLSALCPLLSSSLPFLLRWFSSAPGALSDVTRGSPALPQHADAPHAPIPGSPLPSASLLALCSLLSALSYLPSHVCFL